LALLTLLIPHFKKLNHSHFNALSKVVQQLLVLLLLATIILVAEAVRNAAPRDLLIVGCLLLPVGLAETKLFASFLKHQEP